MRTGRVGFQPNEFRRRVRWVRRPVWECRCIAPGCNEWYESKTGKRQYCSDKCRKAMFVYRKEQVKKEQKYETDELEGTTSWDSAATTRSKGPSALADGDSNVRSD